MTQNGPAPKPGETFCCAACGRESIAKAQKLMEGWRCLGETVVCAFCKAPVGPPVALAETGDRARRECTDARDRLASFLDTSPVAAPEFRDKQKGHFCKDCRHYLKHPFYSRCLYHEKSVEPMDDCPDFTPKPADPEPARPTGGKPPLL
jgi:hypothetical protein